MRLITDLSLLLIPLAFAGCTAEVGSSRSALGGVVDDTAPPSGADVVVPPDGGTRDAGPTLPTLTVESRPMHERAPGLSEPPRRLDREPPSLRPPTYVGPGGDPCPVP